MDHGVTSPDEDIAYEPAVGAYIPVFNSVPFSSYMRSGREVMRLETLQAIWQLFSSRMDGNNADPEDSVDSIDVRKKYKTLVNKKPISLFLCHTSYIFRSASKILIFKFSEKLII